MTWIDIGMQLDIMYVAEHFDELSKECLSEKLSKLTILEASTDEQLLQALDALELSQNCPKLLIIDALTLFLQLRSESEDDDIIFIGALKELLGRIQRDFNCAMVLTSCSDADFDESEMEIKAEMDMEDCLVETLLLDGLVDFHIELDANGEAELLA